MSTSGKPCVFIPVPVVIIKKSSVDKSPSPDITSDKEVCVWKKTKSSIPRRADGFIASSRALHARENSSSEEGYRENGKKEDTPPPTEIQKPLTQVSESQEPVNNAPPKMDQLDPPDMEELMEEVEVEVEIEEGGKEKDVEEKDDDDFCEVDPRDARSTTPLLFRYRGNQLEWNKKDGPIDVSEIFVEAVSLLKDPDRTSSSLVSILDSQHISVTNPNTDEKTEEQQLIQICIPEHKLVKMMTFSPLQTIRSFVDTLLNSISKSEESEDYQMVFPIFLDGSINAFTLDSNAAFGIYGIGMNADEVAPTLFLFRKTLDNVYDIPKFEFFVRTKVSSKEDAKMSAWLQILTSWNAFIPDSITHSLVQKTVSQMAIAGIPSGIRGWAWRQISGCFAMASEHPTLYTELLTQAHDNPPPYMRRIKVDLPRSLPRHPFFAKGENFGQPSLKRVLLAFGQYDKSIGYCQGINFLAATLLCFMDEESAFWTLVQMINKYHMKNFYTDGIKLLRSTLKAFKTLLAEDIPELSKFLEDSLIPIDVFIPSWFQTLFSGVDLNFHIVVRIWDMFFCEGQQFIYKVSLAFLGMLKDTLLHSGMENAMKILQLRKGCIDSKIDPSELIENAMKVKTRPSMDPTNKEYH